MKTLWWCAIALVAAALPSAATASDTEGFGIEITPYLWMQGMDGDVSVGQREASFEQDFGDLTDNVDGGFSGLIAPHWGRFVLFGQFDYVDLGLNGDGFDGGLPANIDGNVEETIVTGAAGYRFDTFGENYIDVMIGGRDLNLDTELRAFGNETSNEFGPTDAIVMLRPMLKFSEHWAFNATLSVAVSGDSDEHYEMSPQILYRFSDTLGLRFGYRRLHYELEEGDDDSTNFRAIDVDLSGFMIGLGWIFPARSEPVVAAAPAPAPAPAPKPAAVAAGPADSDRDGVPDSADKCPGTPPGTRVGPHGCDCDVTIQLQFEFDSAVLTAGDKERLDAAAKRLVELNFVEGVADGYADSTGDEQYNIGLSERRAKAAVDYLATKGVGAGRIKKVTGHGEANPIADNSTAEGRAQNRRVVIRRVDCGP